MATIEMTFDLDRRFERSEASDAQKAEAFLRRSIAKAIRKSSKSRDQICGELSKLVGVRVSRHMLNAYTSESNRSARFPASFVVPLCQILGDDELQRCVIESHLRELLEFGERAAAILKRHL